MIGPQQLAPSTINPYSFKGDTYADSGANVGAVGIGLQIASAVGTAVGAYYSIQATKERARAQASALEYQRHMGNIAARQAEVHAQDLIQAGHSEVGRAGLRYAQIKAATETRQAARGIQGGVGSAAEVVASIDLAKEVDQRAITMNAVRAAASARRGGVATSNQAQMMGISASNVQASAKGLSGGLAAGTSLLGSAGRVAQNWYQYDRTT